MPGSPVHPAWLLFSVPWPVPGDVLNASLNDWLRAGNDLARVLHWGGSMGGYASYSARDMLRAVNQSTVALLDRWNVSIQPTVRSVA